ncbi:MAG: formate dehydrogenase accessory sulfurtransferase FdhD [Deltaproteobacteria bacterium]|nr:formate dehydrogenase accessory sulfurtransferase FdhD [Deltaproteobacteria bacterium]
MSTDERAAVRRRVDRLRVDGAVDVVDDLVAVEEPLELQVASADGPFRPVAVVMRTPDDDGVGDEELALGFLRTEGVIRSTGDVARIGHCTTLVDADADGNVLQVRLADGVGVDWRRLTRHVFSASSCGVCGKATLQAVAATLPDGRVASEVVVDAPLLQALVLGLRDHQTLFASTGGTHAALLASSTGEVLAVREDVGRHNAVDKVLGAALRARAPLDRAIVVVSGRIAFELVQKCAVAGIGLLAGVGAPTSLAATLGERVGVGVVGFVGAQRLNVYAARWRVRP